jgi:hypothetical protein
MAEDKHKIRDEDIMMTDEERSHLKKILEKLMESGSMTVYGDEDGTDETVSSHGCGRKRTCKSICCSFTFALTKEEVTKGIIKWNKKRPYFIAREKDGFCPHLDRRQLRCCIYKDRPKRCRKYHCNNDPNVWLDWDKGILNNTVFDHLPKKT